VKVSFSSHTRIEALSHLLYTLDTSIPKEEALQLSKDIFEKQKHLQKSLKFWKAVFFKGKR